MLFLKRKFIIGAICLAVSCLLAWQLLRIAERTKETVSVLRVAERVEKGAKISGDMLRSVEIGSYGVESGTLRPGDEPEGKYAAADIFPQDNLTPDKFTDYGDIIDSYVLKAQQAEKLAVSVTIKSISAAVSGKLMKGDAVSVLVFVNEGGQGASKGYVAAYPELACMEIAAITNSKAVDVNYDPERETEPDKLRNAGESAFPVSVAFIADEAQALRLVEAENIGSIHLVFRGRGAYGESLLRRHAAGELAGSGMDGEGGADGAGNAAGASEPGGVGGANGAAAGTGWADGANGAGGIDGAGDVAGASEPGGANGAGNVGGATGMGDSGAASDANRAAESPADAWDGAWDGAGDAGNAAGAGGAASMDWAGGADASGGADEMEWAAGNGGAGDAAAAGGATGAGRQGEVGADGAITDADFILE